MFVSLNGKIPHEVVVTGGEFVESFSKAAWVSPCIITGVLHCDLEVSGWDVTIAE